MVEILKALADENRLRVFNLLLNDELCVCELEVILNLTQPNVSKHLLKLRSAGIIESQKEAQWVHYKVSDEFKERYAELIKGLESGFMVNEDVNKDLKKLRRYHQEAFNCQIINKDRESVIETINSEE